MNAKLAKFLRGSALAALIAAVLAAGAWYRSHLIADTTASATATAEQRLVERTAEAVKAARKDDAKITAATVASLNAQLIQQKATHDRVSSDLQAALAASDLRAARLDARIVSLLDEAAGLRASAAGTAGGAGSASGEAQADPAQPTPDASVGDLIESVGENYGICRRNAVRLEAL